MSDQDNQVADTGAEDAAVLDITAIIDGTAADETVRGNVNGSTFEYERNVVHKMPNNHYDIIEGAGFPIRTVDGAVVSSPEPTSVDDGAALTGTNVSNEGDGGDPVEGGTGSTVNSFDMSVLDGNVTDVTAKLPEFSRDYLEALLAAEKAGKTRVTVVAAIEAALTGATE